MFHPLPRLQPRLALALLAALVTIPACKNQEPKPPRPGQKVVLRCGSDVYLQKRLAEDPAFAARRLVVQEDAERWLETATAGNAAARSTVAIIPTVVHVLWNTSSANISTAQIQSQIDSLNEDYRAANADSSSVPSVFAPLIGDVRLEFRLAQRDPECGPTDGINRVEVSASTYSLEAEDAKSTSAGGVDPWPADRYLNIWVVPEVTYTGVRILGYSSFPGESAALDGFVVEHFSFGSVGTATAPYDLGRTATHELGHYFDMYHIWGDDGTACSGSDDVADTPNQGGFNLGCPTFPHVSCSNGPDGDLFMNYMDYVDDDCMVMFTQGQADKAAAVLFTTRASLLGSDGAIPPPAVSTADLFMKDSPADLGNEPNMDSDRFYRSEDIWVRRTNDGFTQQEHENPLHRPTGPSNFVYVRVRNRGCGDAGSAELFLYWAKASSGLSWTAPWDGSVTSPALMGGAVGTQSTGMVSAGEFTILEFPWSPPNPADYASFGADRTHFCLLARLQTSSMDPFGMTAVETSNLSANVQNNNNIVWKNVSVATEGAGGRKRASFLIANYDERDQRLSLAFQGPDGFMASAFDYGQLTAFLPPELEERWVKAGSRSDLLTPLGDGAFRIQRPGAAFHGLPLDSGEHFAIRVEASPEPSKPWADVYALDAAQYVDQVDPETFVGAQRILFSSRK